MTTSSDIEPGAALGEIFDGPSPGALPRSNGEIVFDEPWESRAFGTAVALIHAGTLDQERFRQGLIADIGAWEAKRAVAEGLEWSYYERWLAALEAELLSTGLVTPAELDGRVAALAEATAHEHDHDHDHEEA